MRIVLSRKGFDSKYGGCPSPILEDGTLLSLPIPDVNGRRRLADLCPRGIPLAPIVADLTNGRLKPEDTVHLDPDLDATTIERSAHWRPAFGQARGAGRHLDLQEVGPNDVFLFFGWFREVARYGGKWRYVPKAPDLHVVFGWLRVGMRTDDCSSSVRLAVAGHPHCDPVDRPHNRIYVANSCDDGGVFPRFHAGLQLTWPGETRSIWRLPHWFDPGSRPPLSHHGRSDRWRRAGSEVRLSTVGIGQEFVLNAAFYPEAAGWLEAILSGAG